MIADNEQARRLFEEWISSSPYEKQVSRFPDDETRHAWPGQYQHIEVQLAWEAWMESMAKITGAICKACREKVSVASKNKTARCVECMEPIGGSHYVPFIVNEETRYIHQLCAERRLMMGRKIYP